MASGDRITKTQRWLDLIALLLGRKIPLTVEDIMERVPAYAQGVGAGDAKSQASARRMFERDKDELRKAGIPLETVRYGINYGAETLEGYRIARQDLYLPYLRLVTGERPGASSQRRKPYPGLPEVELSLEEAAPAFDALRRVAGMPGFPFPDAARSALRKLSFDLDPSAVGEAPVVWVERGDTREILARLRILSDALLARKRVRFDYRGIARDETTERDVAPYGVFFQLGEWYLVGHDGTRGAVRVFRVGRIGEVRPNGRSPKQPDYETPPDFELERYLGRSAWELGEPEEAVEVDVLLHFPLSALAERRGEGTPVEQRAGGAAVRRFRVAQPDPFLRWVLSQLGDAEILEPGWLRDELRTMARAALANHAAGEGGVD